MKAIGYTGNPDLNVSDVFVEIECDTPTPKGRELLIEVTAISVNPIDTKIRQRITQPQNPPKILGWDASGIVRAVGADVSLFGPGDRVYYAGDTTHAGCNASHQLVDERVVGHAPKSLSEVESAAMPLTTVTAWEALFDRLRIDPKRDAGKQVLIIGGAGGVGSIAIQLVKQVAGLEVVTTASRPETIEWCEQMGADVVLNHREDLIAQYQQRQLASPNYIFCLNSTDNYMPAMMELVAPQGMICALVDAQKSHDLNPLKIKSAGFVWEFMSTRPIFDTPDLIRQHEILEQVAQLIDDGKLKTTLQTDLGSLTPETLVEAHRLLETGRTIGKIALQGMSA